MTIAVLLLLALQQPTQTPPARPPATTPAPTGQTTPAQPGQTTPTQPGQTTPTQPGTTAPAAPRRVAPSTATLEIKVIDRSGRGLPDSHVALQGPASREETSDKSGIVTLKSIPPGTYRVRGESDGYVALEKEIAVKGATAPIQVLLPLSFAPAPPEPEPKVEAPPPPPPPPPPPTLGTPGEPRTLSIPDLAERSLGG